MCIYIYIYISHSQSVAPQAIRDVSLPKISPRSQSKPTRARFFQPAGGECTRIERRG